MSTFIETLLGAEQGSIAIIKPDYMIINDGVSSTAIDRIATVGNQDKVWVFHDHDVPTGSPAAAEILKKNLAFARKHGCHYVQAEGIGYQYLLDEEAKPGQILIGGGSHASIFGAKGALGINVSIPELARVVETGRYSLIVPESVSFTLGGTVAQDVSMMDVAMAFLAKAEGLEGKVIEFYAPALAESERSVLCSMATLTGAFTAVMVDHPAADANILDLSQVEPMVMLPVASRGEQAKAAFVPKRTLAGTKLEAGQVGGYTGGTIEALRKAAAKIEGKTLARGFRLSIVPATGNDYLQALEEGIIADFIDYGAQIQAPGDRSVVVQGAGAMGPEENLLTTGLYTFAGAMGSAKAAVYSASPESVIEASYSKKI